jgi:Probable cobalt transporter subunit (CbtA)
MTATQAYPHDFGRRQRCHFVGGAFVEPLMAAAQKRFIARGLLAGAMGGLLAVAFAVSHGRLSSIRPGTLVLLLAADALAALSVLPSVNYPPSPVSAVGDETATRTGLYLLVVGLSLALIIGAVWVGRRLAARLGSWNATLVGAGAYGVGIAAAMWLLRPIDQGSRPMTSTPCGCPRWPRTWCYGRPSQRFSQSWRAG